MPTVTFNLEQLILLPGTSVLLKDVNWQEFESVISQEHRLTRLAYDRGMLEIMVPLPEHEYYKEAIGDLIKDLAFELQLGYESFGSTTWKREKSLAGVEPDNCFYIKNLQAIQDKLNVNLDVDPPPDLVIEIDITSKSLERLPIYARIGVLEVWRYEQGQLRIYQLRNREYVETETSLAFPNFPIKLIPDFIQQHLVKNRLELRQAFRNWVQQVRSGSQTNSP